MPRSEAETEVHITLHHILFFLLSSFRIGHGVGGVVGRTLGSFIRERRVRVQLFPNFKPVRSACSESLKWQLQGSGGVVLSYTHVQGYQDSRFRPLLPTCRGHTSLVMKQVYKCLSFSFPLSFTSPLNFSSSY